MNIKFSSNVELGIREVRQVTGLLKDKYGLDYSDYALTSFKRRVENFLSTKRYGIEELLKQLASPDFLDHFAGKIAVPETEMFRDPTFWILLKNNYISNLVKENPKTKIWLPMCASGEEYFSLAILLKECAWTDSIEVFVSSMSNESLEEIRHGAMCVEKLEVSSKNYSRFQGTSNFADYYKTSGNKVIFDKTLFSNTKFFKDGLDFSKEMPHINLVLFRNKFIYFNSSLQYKVCDALYNKMAAKGLLALGVLEEVEGKFSPVNKNESVFLRRG